MEISLEAISPIVYSLIKPGSIAEIRLQLAKKNEYREKIPVVQDTLVVFKGITKVGIIPRGKVAELGSKMLVGKCRITKMDISSNTIIVDIPPKVPKV